MLKFKIDGVEMPNERNNITGIKYNKHWIWTSNSGRAVTADFIGDITAMKNSVELVFSYIYASDFNTIQDALPSLDKPFVTVTFEDEEGVFLDFLCYSSDVTFDYGGVAGKKRYYTSINFSLTGV